MSLLALLLLVADTLSQTTTCDDTCAGTANDGTCDDGGSGSTFNSCSCGTDCTDCGTRTEAPGEYCGVSGAPGQPNLYSEQIYVQRRSPTTDSMRILCLTACGAS